jgi:hypothetical protein
MPDIYFFCLSNLVFCLVELELSETLSVCISALVWLFAFLGIHQEGHTIGLFHEVTCAELVLRRFLMPDIHMLILVVRPDVQFCSS